MAFDLNITHQPPSKKKEVPIYENGLFVVLPVNFADPVLNERVTGYGIFNKKTDIREAECRREFTARALADGFEHQHMHPEEYIEQPASDISSFDTGSGTAH